MNRKDTVAWCALLVVVAILGVVLGHGFWPVTVVETVKPEPESPWTIGWDAAVAVSTIALAGVTAWLAYRTSEMAKDATLAREDAARQLVQDDMHHRQQLSGVLVMDELTLVQTIEQKTRGGDDWVAAISMKQHVRNVGAGPALNILLWIDLPNEPEITFIVNVGTLESNRTFPIKLQVDRRTLDTQGKWDAEHWNWDHATVRFTYTNIFNDTQKLLFHCTGKQVLENQDNEILFAMDQVNLNDSRQLWMRPIPPRTDPWDNFPAT
jgi:hypothetical protein